MYDALYGVWPPSASITAWRACMLSINSLKKSLDIASQAACTARLSYRIVPYHQDNGSESSPSCWHAGMLVSFNKFRPILPLVCKLPRFLYETLKLPKSHQTNECSSIDPKSN